MTLQCKQHNIQHSQCYRSNAHFACFATHLASSATNWYIVWYETWHVTWHDGQDNINQIQMLGLSAEGWGLKTEDAMLRACVMLFMCVFFWFSLTIITNSARKWCGTPTNSSTNDYIRDETTHINTNTYDNVQSLKFKFKFKFKFNVISLLKYHIIEISLEYHIISYHIIIISSITYNIDACD